MILGQITDNVDHDYFMSIAIEEAIIAGDRGDRLLGRFSYTKVK